MQVCFRGNISAYSIFKSNWLHIHVTTAAAGQAILAISFITGVMYLLKNVDQSTRSKRTFWLETVVFTLVCTVGFIGVTTVFSSMKYEAKFQWIDKMNNKWK